MGVDQVMGGLRLVLHGLGGMVRGPGELILRTAIFDTSFGGEVVLLLRLFEGFTLIVEGIFYLV